jgi:hypothetical protein
MLLWLLVVLGILVVLLIAQLFYLAFVLRWEDEQTVALNYYGRPPSGRAQFKRSLRLHARLLSPALWLNSRVGRLDFSKSRIQYKGISAPAGSCSVLSFERAEQYEPRAEDLFVVTQMKCGTTWMQHLVYEVLMRGNGDLADKGTALYAISPWLEGRKSVPVEQAPLIGTERPSRIIKTHLPAQLCPSRPHARYVYVVRHPGSCFASCRDFVMTNVGALAPSLVAFEQWFCSNELMWWGTWSEHVKGWWNRAQHDQNVLFVSFEDMKRDLNSVIVRVAEFLGMASLDPAERDRIAQKCGFSYMQQNQGLFEMQPPHILQTNAALFVSGAAERHRDVPADLTRRILAWARQELAASPFPLERFYPDVAEAGARIVV